MKHSYLEQLVLNRIERAGLPMPEREVRFCPTRRFRFDFCWPGLKTAIELNGGVWTRGRHLRGQGYINDLKKLNLAVKLGWRVLQYTPDMIDEIAPDLKTIFENLR